MPRYFITIIAASQLTIQAIAMGRAISVPDLGSHSKFFWNYYEKFFAGCCPERINPDDKKHLLPSIMKVISGSLPAVANT